MTTSKYLKLASIAAVAMIATPALADVPAVTVSGTASQLGNPPFTLGYTFQTSKSFKVNGLGVFDDNSDGLASAHDVGLWDAAGNLLASTNVAAGTAGTLIDGFRFSSIGPVSIAAGTYRVGALFTDNADNLFFPGFGTITNAAGVTYLSGAYVGGGTLSDPTFTGSGAPSYIGGNLLVAGVPEPATWAMMIVGFGAVGGALRARRTSKVSFA